jgi:hypothetical protein
VVFVSIFSGHCFQIVHVVGEILAGLAMKGIALRQGDFLSLRRFDLVDILIQPF